MAKHVIILGAGASKGAGAPLMNNFLDEARRILANGKAGQKQQSFERVFRAISKLQNVHSKADLDIHNIESVFTTFEMAKTLKKFPQAVEKDIDELIDDLKWLIVITLEQTVLFRYANQKLHPDNCYNNFVKVIKEVREQNSRSSVAILTFNYDIALDMAFALANFEIDYGLGPELLDQDRLPFLKLHGSINWTSERNEGRKIIPWNLADYLLKATGYAMQNGKISLPIGSHINSFHPNVDGVPVIVPPSWNKADSHRSVANVWARAASELGEAESIYIVGYSLPPTDSFFKQLYALGTVGDNPLKRFWVFNPDTGLKSTFSSMLGPGAKQRFEFMDTVFSQSLDKLKAGLSD